MVSQVVQSITAVGKNIHLTSTNSHACSFYGHFAASLDKPFQLDPCDAAQLQPERRMNKSIKITWLFKKTL